MIIIILNVLFAILIHQFLIFISSKTLNFVNFVLLNYSKTISIDHLNLLFNCIIIFLAVTISYYNKFNLVCLITLTMFVNVHLVINQFDY